MLKQRVITALILLLVLIPALLYPSPAPFNLIALIFIAAAGWEWARMNGATGTAAGWAGVVCLLVCGAMGWAGWVTQPLPRLWLLTGSVWVLASAWVLRAGVPAWATYPQALRLGLGLAALCLTPIW